MSAGRGRGKALPKDPGQRRVGGGLQGEGPAPQSLSSCWAGGREKKATVTRREEWRGWRVEEVNYGKGKLRGSQEVRQFRDRAASWGRESRKESSPKAPSAVSRSPSLCLNWEAQGLQPTPLSGSGFLMPPPKSRLSRLQ